jgi:hypothetical protein
MPSLILQVIGAFLAAIWPVLAFAVLLPLFTSTWLYYRREKFKREAIKWMLLELKIPREIRKSPRAMEQVLTSIHNLRNAPGDLREKWWDGEVTLWFSLEIVSFGGEVHFYIRFHRKYKDIVEAAFFSYYPDVEVIEVDDYVDRFPANIREMYSHGYDLWGGEMLLEKPEAYPIRTYPEFEAPEEEKQYDPIATFLEVLGKLKKEEMVGIQILIAPRDDASWRDKWAPLVEKLRQSKSEKPQVSVSSKTAFPGGPLPAFEVVKKESSEEPGFFKSFMRTPGETDVLKAVENNLSKPAFDTLIRFVYFSPQPLFYDSFPRRGLRAAFNQYGALDINSFKINYAVATRTRIWQWPHLFPKIRNEYRKQRILYNYRHRVIPPDTFMGRLLTSHLFNWNFSSKSFGMSTVCLATLYHLPTYLVVTAPHIKRIESRKAGPPAGLAIYGEENEIDKYQ